MREIIDGKMYDTDTSKFLYSIEVEISVGDISRKRIEKLYQANKSAKYFLCVLDNERDPMQPISRQVQDNDGWEIFEFTNYNARKWAEKFLPTIEIEKIFKIEMM